MIVINARFLTQKISGVQRFAIEICKELVKINVEVKLVSPKNIIHSELFDFFKCEVVGTNTGYIWEQIDLPIYLKRHEGPLLLNLCNLAPIFYRNKVSIIHDMAVFANASWFSWKFVLAYRFMIPIIARTSKKIGTVSDFSKREIIKFLKAPSDKIFIVSNAVSTNFELEHKLEKGLIAENYILTVGSLDPRKNLLSLIKAFNSRKNKNTKLVIVGSTNNVFKDQKISELIKENDAIVLSGYVSDTELINLYKNASAFFYLSLYEGFGIPPLEAMTFKIPCVVSNIAVFKEIFEDACCYVDPLDIPQITFLFDKVMSNPSNQVESYNRVLKKYSWQKSALSLVSHLHTQYRINEG
ncbi:glycosyltransferase family 4 protein [Reichenbachiella agarivorans]|uniref:Glycosyltransferase family 4 protein n=1 Tax=Reichenbachiella agarivorans TaxID=2979464 RepID=A0ABY6CU81_9BACT|nr:glycosyltransferase family 1 protein [Reichenbachiella agarivorans]UXP33550.1 glycosyltransferase family 4 protein [Reichenbachiella agarivorans]